MVAINPNDLVVKVTTISIFAALALLLAAIFALLILIRFHPALRARVLNAQGVPFELPQEALRSRFQDELLIPKPIDRNHQHGASAADRSTGTEFISRFSKNLARRAWFYQCSASDQRNGRLGSRQYYWAKDLTATPAVFKPRGGDLVAMVDVDQYVNMPKMLSKVFRPYLIYTFQPGDVSRSSGEFSYYFNQKNEVEYRVSGGACYVHTVWNYNMDSLKATDYFWGIPIRLATYLVDKRETDSDHQLILLTPLRKFGWLTAWLATLLEAPQLERLNPVEGEFVRMVKHTKVGVSYITGKVNRYVSVSVPADVDATIESLSITSKVGLTLPQVKTNVKTNDAGATILYEYYTRRKTANPRSRTHVLPAAGHVRSYQFYPEEFYPEAKPSMVSFMSPLVDGAFAPSIVRSNADRAVKGRIEEARNVKVDERGIKRIVKELKSFHQRVVDEFVDLFLGNLAGSLSPFEPEDVYSKQDRPTQRRIIEEAEFCEPKRVNKTFMKKEAYAKLSDPRIISTINGRDKIDYSQFMYAFTELLKQQRWYAFGKTPIEIAHRVAEICSSAKWISSTDFTRMDGHIDELYRILERQLFIRAFMPQYTTIINELLRSQQNMRGFMSLPDGDCITFDQGLARASGSPETSAFNTVDSAFTAYLALRRTVNPTTRSHYSPLEAWSKLGLYGGDDGLTPDVPSKNYVKAAKECGQVLDIVVTERHCSGLKFLSRIYGPDVFSGDVVSMTDIKRTLSKFHVTSNMPLNVTNVDKLLDKSCAYYLTDKYTPVLGDFVTAVMRCAPDGHRYTNICNIWNAQYSSDVQYPNSPANWMYDVLLNELPEYDLTTLREWLPTCTTLEHFLSPPVCYPVIDPTGKLPAVVDDDIYNPSVPLLSDFNEAETSRAAWKRPRRTATPDKRVRRQQSANRGRR
jgi:hypothetical protein